MAIIQRAPKLPHELPPQLHVVTLGFIKLHPRRVVSAPGFGVVIPRCRDECPEASIGSLQDVAFRSKNFVG
jgi:hypothetical protein